MGNAPSSGAVRQHVENAQKTGVLQLSQRKLSVVPPEVLRVGPNLRTLDLSDNRLRELPLEMSEMKAMKTLKLQNNRLSVLPEELSALTKLETLLVSNNLLASFPRCSTNWKALRQLDASNNQLMEFPVCLCGLPNMDLLDLSGNRIATIPDAAAGLSTTELNLNRNQVSFISPGLARSSRLKTLRLEENCLGLAAIPAELLKESNVSLLSVEGNLFAMKEFMDIDGYDQYMERYTATKKKFGT